MRDILIGSLLVLLFGALRIFFAYDHSTVLNTRRAKLLNNVKKRNANKTSQVDMPVEKTVHIGSVGEINLKKVLILSPYFPIDHFRGI